MTYRRDMRQLFLMLLLIVTFAATAHAQPIGVTKCIASTPTLDTGAYASGDAMGTKGTLTNALRPGVGTGYLVSLTVADKAAQAVDLSVVLFGSDPTLSAAGMVDQSAFDPDDDDLPKILGVVSFGAGNRTAFADNSVHHVNSTVLPVYGATSAAGPSGTLYYQLVAGGAYDGASSGDVTLTFCFAQD